MCLDVLASLCPLLPGPLAARLAGAVLASGFELAASLLSVRVSYPTSVLVREAAMLVHLQAVLAAAPPPPASGAPPPLLAHRLTAGGQTDVRDVIKILLVPQLRRALEASGARVLDSLPSGTPGALALAVTWTHETLGPDCSLLLGPPPKGYHAPKQRVDTSCSAGRENFGAVMKAVSAVLAEAGAGPSAALRARLPPPAAPARPALLLMQITREPVLVAGRYVKHARNLSQSPWAVGGQRFGATSVEEIIVDVIKQRMGGGGTPPPPPAPAPAPALSPAPLAVTFMSAGREDMDVRMLGDGRPFVLEVANARRTQFDAAAYAAMAAAMSASHGELVEVRDLRPSSAEELAAVKRSAASKRKSYVCVVGLSSHVTPAQLAALDAAANLVVLQRTPVRVLHRRSQLTRRKTVFCMRTEFLNSRFFILRLQSSAGMYIKEFVHGDLGRTVPSVGQLLGCDADILQARPMAPCSEKGWPTLC